MGINWFSEDFRINILEFQILCQKFSFKDDLSREYWFKAVKTCSSTIWFTYWPSDSLIWQYLMCKISISFHFFQKVAFPLSIFQSIGIILVRRDIRLLENVPIDSFENDLENGKRLWRLYTYNYTMKLWLFPVIL